MTTGTDATSNEQTVPSGGRRSDAEVADRLSTAPLTVKGDRRSSAAPMGLRPTLDREPAGPGVAPTSGDGHTVARLSDRDQELTAMHASRTADHVAIPAPRTEHHTPPQRMGRPRVWLVAGLGALPEPFDHPSVRDHQGRCWEYGTDRRYHTADGWHHATWAELHARFDLVEVAP